MDTVAREGEGEHVVADAVVTVPLVGSRSELAKLEATYANATIRKKIRTLALAYPTWRAIRGDGNCFYRALWVGLVEEAAAAAGGVEVDPAGALRERFQAAETALLRRPDGSTTTARTSDDDDGSLWRQVQHHLTASTTQHEHEQKRDWARWYEDSEVSDTFVRYLRSLTSRSLEQRRDELAAFLPEGQSLADRRTLAERMGEEAEQLEMSALADALAVAVRIYQLDRSEGPFAVYTLGPPPPPPPQSRRELTLLYRPGHYDLLYKR